MKKKVVFIALLLLLCFNYTYSQKEDRICFVQAHTFDDLAGMFQFNNYLYQLKNNTLDTIFEISSQKEFLHAVKYYPTVNRVVFYKDGWKYNNKKTIGMINTQTLKTKIHNVDYPNYNITGGILAKKNKEEKFVLKLFSGGETPKGLFISYNINNFNTKIEKPEIYKFMELVGAPGGVMKGKDYSMVYTSLKSGKLYIPQTSTIESRPVFPIKIPDSLQINKKKRISMLINNEDCFVVSLKKSGPNPEEIGYSKLIIKDKEKNSWYSYVIKGNRQVIRGFEHWLGGAVATDNVRFIKNEKGNVIGKEEFDRVCPGKNERRKKAKSTGTTFDKRASYQHVYYPGILYLLNPQTKEYIEWDTEQGDSEILLVKNDTVYYRINDKIYKAPIIKGKKLGKSEFLIQDERVPDIHWAFITEK
ncbi:MAG: hypothetical protein ACOC3T_02240 [Bacteroidota bacterium]